MLTASGLIVRFLKVFEKNEYNSVKWVRYLTKASGTYQIRVSAMLPSSLLVAKLWVVLMTLEWILEGIVDFSVQNESDFNEHLLLSLRLLQYGREA